MSLLRRERQCLSSTASWYRRENDHSGPYAHAALAVVVSAILLAVGLPLAYWLAFSRQRWKFFIEAFVSLPIVLPPTVLGFYVLVAIGPLSPFGRWYHALTGHNLA